MGAAALVRGSVRRQIRREIDGLPRVGRSLVGRCAQPLRRGLYAVAVGAQPLLLLAGCLACLAVRGCVADELVRTVFTTLTGHGHLHFTFRARLLRGAGGLLVSYFNVGQIL